MTGAALRLAVPDLTDPGGEPRYDAGAGPGREFSHILAGVVLDAAAARLARMLDPAFLAGAGWDPAARVLSLPAGHQLLGRVVCRTGGCDTTVRAGLGGVCHRCFTRLSEQGLTARQIAAAPQLPSLPPRMRQRGARLPA